MVPNVVWLSVFFKMSSVFCRKKNMKVKDNMSVSNYDHFYFCLNCNPNKGLHILPGDFTSIYYFIQIQ